MIDKLRKICDSTLKLKTSKEEKEKYLLIKKILENDRCFLKMDINTAFAILKDLGIKEDIEGIYQALIDKENF